MQEPFERRQAVRGLGKLTGFGFHQDHMIRQPKMCVRRSRPIGKLEFRDKGLLTRRQGALLHETRDEGLVDTSEPSLDVPSFLGSIWFAQLSSDLSYDPCGKRRENSAWVRRDQGATGNLDDWRFQERIDEGVDHFSLDRLPRSDNIFSAWDVESNEGAELVRERCVLEVPWRVSDPATLNLGGKGEKHPSFEIIERRLHRLSHRCVVLAAVTVERVPIPTEQQPCPTNFSPATRIAVPHLEGGDPVRLHGSVEARSLRICLGPVDEPSVDNV